MIVIGHRGARAIAPENTLAAIQKAIEYAADEIEVDVRVTDDGIPILHHDPQLGFATERSVLISNTSFDLLRQNKPDLATLEEAIALINRRKPLIIEVKPEVPIKPIISIVQLYLNKGWRIEDFRFASFSINVLFKLRLRLPNSLLIVNERWSGIRASFRAHRLGTKRITMNQLWLWSGFIKAFSRRGYLLSAYPLNDPYRARRWKKSGLYGVVTAYPDRFKV